MVDLIRGTKRTGPPGRTYRYRNECFGMMAFVIEKLTGTPYDRYVAESILQPLAIDIQSASVPTATMVEHLALPYDVTDNVPRPTGQVRFDVYSAGDGYLRAKTWLGSSRRSSTAGSSGAGAS